MPQGVVVSLPHVRTPDVGFEQPFAPLDVCHDRVRRSLDLLCRLVEHLQTVGHDADARSAAHDAWRYFEIAAPAHHADEELHVLPRLRQSGDPWLADAARRLLAGHEALRSVWQQLGPLVREVHESVSALSARALDALHARTGQFLAIHERHLRLEDSFAFPAVQERMQADQLAAMGHEMQRRRMERINPDAAATAPAAAGAVSAPATLVARPPQG
jgi:hemerythrin-like domain-containing protein